CQAPAPHSPTAYDTALQDTIQCLLSEFLAKVLAAVQGLDQQPVEQRTLAQSVDDVTARTPVAPQVTEPPLAAEPLQEASTAPLKPPACEDGENAASPMSGAHQGEASTDIVSPAAHEDEVASPSPQNPPAEAGTPHLALTASLPSRMPWLEGEGPPSSGGRSRLCARLSAAVPAQQDGKRI
ncbi:unnamed protein product, partial [Bubo scandiacus]